MKVKPKTAVLYSNTILHPKVGKPSYFAFPGMNFHIIYQRRSLVGKLGEKK